MIYRLAIRIGAVVALVASLMGATGGAFAMASDWSVNDQGKLRLVSAIKGVGERKSLALGLEFKLQPGWKIYWRSPGDAGYPPRIDWAKSKNVASAQFQWPVPERFSVLGLETLGYKDEVILPLKVEPVEPGKPVALRADISYLTCDEICVPHQVKLGLDLPAAAAKPSDQANVLARYSSKVPLEGPRQDLAIAAVSLAPKGEDVVLKVKATAAKAFANPDLYVEGPEGAFFTRPKVSYATDAKTAVLTLTAGGVPQKEFEAAPLRLTLVDNGRAMEHVVSVRLGEGTVPSVGLGGLVASQSILTIIVLALIGGLILNLMPCVLPVLSIKLLNVVGHGGSERGAVRAGFLASSAGILFSLLLIAGVLIGLKSAGMAIGWGIQFQQPVFLVLLTAILVLFACNLFGLFEITLPGQITNAAAQHGKGDSLSGHFMSGAFATLLATPCSAPFLGTAIGFALSRGPVEILIVFTALGIGFALPYLVIAAFPGLATRLPRPGPWMEHLRRVLGLALVATAVWLLTIVHTLVGLEATIAITALFAIVPMVFAARRLEGSRIGRHAAVVVVGLTAAAVLVPAFSPSVTSTKGFSTATGVWQRFDEAAISRLVAEGKTVIVDVTAEWCITCQVNKAFVFDKGDVAEMLANPSVVAMQADWTRPDPAIAGYLARFGRYGIPFNVVFGPKAPQGIVLPELLTPNAVLSAFADAASDRAVVTK